MNFTSFLPEVSLLIWIIIISLYTFFTDRSKPVNIKVLNFFFISGITTTLLLVFQQLSFAPHSFFSGTVSLDSYGTIIKLLVLFSITSIKFFAGNTYSVKSDKDIIIAFVCLFAVFITVCSNNFILTFTGFELLNLSYFAYLKITTSYKNQKSIISIYRSWIISSSLMLFGISIFYGLFGSLNYDYISNLISSGIVNKLTLTIAVLLIFTGFAFKLFIFPLQSVITNLFENLEIEKAAAVLLTASISGAGSLTRLIQSAFYDRTAFWSSPGIHVISSVFNWETFLQIIFCLTVISSVLMLFLQQDFVKILIYIICINTPLILLSIPVQPEQSLSANLIALLFVTISIIGIMAPANYLKTNFSISGFADLKGLSKREKLPPVFLFTFLLVLSGMPLTLGFSARLSIFAFLDSPISIYLIALSILASFAPVYFVFKLIYASSVPKKGRPKKVIIRKGVSIYLFVLLLIVILSGILYEPLIRLFNTASIYY